MKKQILSLIVSCIISFALQAKIITSPTLETVLSYAQNNTWVIWDIDNTLARTPTALGSDEWFSFLVNQKVASGMDNVTAINATLPLAYYTHFSIPLIPTEKNIPSLLLQLNNLGAISMGLTARGPYLAERTHEQLDAIDIVFNLEETIKNTLIIPAQYPCLYIYGTIFAGNNDKGEVLSTFLTMTNSKPGRIIFVDDKIHHINSVEKAALKHNIDYIGVRYSGCDTYIAQFDPATAENELQNLREQNQLITKKEASLYNNPPTPLWYYPLQWLQSLFSYLSFS